MRLIATSAAVRRIIELTGTHEPLATERSTNQRIADQLFISTHTVAFHLRQLFCKLGIRSRVDLARIALEHARPETTQTP
jgi:ABC-type hemin transport system ATPase subunit